MARKGLNIFYQSVKKQLVYSYMLRKAVETQNLKLIRVMEDSQFLSKNVKMETFRDICIHKDYKTVTYMVHNVSGVRRNLERYIKNIEKSEKKLPRKVEMNLGLLEQELN